MRPGAVVASSAPSGGARGTRLEPLMDPRSHHHLISHLLCPVQVEGAQVEKQIGAGAGDVGGGGRERQALSDGAIAQSSCGWGGES